MAWTDIWERLKRKGGLADEEEYEEGGALADSASTPEKARLARASIVTRQEAGPEEERAFKRSPTYRLEKEKSDEREDEMEKAKAVAIIRKNNRGLSTEEAAAILDKFGGADKFWSGMSMADEEDRIKTMKEIKDLAERKNELMAIIERMGD